MTEYQQQPTGQNQPPGDGKPATPQPCVSTPADQPEPPKSDWKDKCKPSNNWPPTPTIPDPKPCERTCTCPVPPTGQPNCIETLISEQTTTITAAERAKSFKTDLEALAQKAKTAQIDYTQSKYEQLLERWKKEDDDIVALISKLVCAIPCWQCVIECRVCTLYYAVRDIERNLIGTGTRTTVDSLYDLRYWQTRDTEAKQAAFDRIKGVLAAWEKPAQTIEKVLNDNATLMQTAGKTLAPDAPKLLYDVFMRLVPMHLLIAPPADVWKTKIDKKYTHLCRCDKGDPENCCGPDSGTPSLLERLLGPQPYLIKPDEYFWVICCLTMTRYQPAKEALAAAEGALEATENAIKRAKADIDSKMKSIEGDAKTELGKKIDCSKEKPNGKPPGDKGYGCKEDTPPKDTTTQYDSGPATATPSSGAAAA